MATQVTLNSGSVDSAGSLALKTNGTTTAVTIDASQNVGIGTASPNSKLEVTSRITASDGGGASRIALNIESNTSAQTYCGINSYNYGTSTARNLVLNESGGNVGIGTISPNALLNVNGTCNFGGSSGVRAGIGQAFAAGQAEVYAQGAVSLGVGTAGAEPVRFYSNSVERARIDSSGNLLVGKTASNVGTVGAEAGAAGYLVATVSQNACIYANRTGDDGTLVAFRQDNVGEGSISVSGTTVSYNGGHLSRWAQTIGPKDDTLVKGTVLSNLDEMNVYTDAEGNPVDNEQLNKVKVSDVEGDANVAGVFVNWTHDEAHNVDEINMAMTGDMIIRIAQGTTVQRGDLLMSAGDGTAKPQGDDIVRSKTIAKVTSTHVTCTYADGSFCVPCVLMAC